MDSNENGENGGRVAYVAKKGEGHQKLKLGFGEGHTSFRKHYCSLRIKINNQKIYIIPQTSPLHSKHFKL